MMIDRCDVSFVPIHQTILRLLKCVVANMTNVTNSQSLLIISNNNRDATVTKHDDREYAW
jgi:hypothetical protein